MIINYTLLIETMIFTVCFSIGYNSVKFLSIMFKMKVQTLGALRMRDSAI